MGYVDVTDLCKSYKQTKVFENINLSIEEGELLTLLGPSGCGKSTLLRCIAGLEEINSGKIFVDGKNISNLNPKDRNISMVFQSYALFPNMTAGENIAFGLKMKKMPRSERDKKVATLISLVGLEGKEQQYPKQLSGGQQQRVALARALAVEPKILLLDEPLSALDAKIRLSLRNLIKNIQRELKITTIFVTHDQEEALSISDRIFVMEKGEIVQAGTPEEIYKEPKTRFVASFLGTFNFLDSEFLNEPGEKKDIFVRPEHIRVIQGDKVTNQEQYLAGIINNVFFLGNIIRIEVKINDTVVLVDTLNCENNHYTFGEKVFLSIPKEKYIHIA